MVLGASGGLKHIKNVIKSGTVTIPANGSASISGTLSGIIILSEEGSFYGTIIAATIYGNPNIVDIAGSTSISGITVTKGGGNEKLTVSSTKGESTSLHYTFISSGSPYNIP